MNIRPYEHTDFDRLLLFLRRNWAPKHALYNRSLFDWQYRHDQPSHSLVLEREDQILGFLGVIWNDYALEGRDVSGAALTLWVVAEELRQTGVGIMMMKETIGRHDVALTLGCNTAVLPTYQKMGFATKPALNRYVFPLQPSGFRQLLENPSAASVEDIESWMRQAPFAQTPAGELIPQAKDLERLYENSVRGCFSFSAVRNAGYWLWRYINHPVFKYRFFGDPGNNGVVVARIEEVVSDDLTLNKLRVLRLIELIPADPTVWTGAENDSFTQLLRQTLLWGQNHDCVAADFQCSHSRLDQTLKHIGFKNQEEPDSPATCRLTRLFQPFRRGLDPINIVWNAGTAQNRVSDANTFYLMKSDCDMDRPNSL